jgi:hypothetical protein
MRYFVGADIMQAAALCHYVTIAAGIAVEPEVPFLEEIGRTRRLKWPGCSLRPTMQKTTGEKVRAGGFKGICFRRVPGRVEVSRCGDQAVTKNAEKGYLAVYGCPRPIRFTRL